LSVSDSYCNITDPLNISKKGSHSFYSFLMFSKIKDINKASFTSCTKVQCCDASDSKVLTFDKTAML